MFRKYSENSVRSSTSAMTYIVMPLFASLIFEYASVTWFTELIQVHFNKSDGSSIRKLCLFTRFQYFLCHII